MKGVNSFSAYIKKVSLPRLRKAKEAGREWAEEAISRRDEQLRFLTDTVHACREYLGYTDVATSKLKPDIHVEIAKELTSLEKHHNSVLMAARGHLKTSVVRAWLLQQIIDKSNIRILMLSASDDLTKDTLEVLKLHCESERLQKLFPRRLWEEPYKQAPQWSADAMILPRTRIVSGPTLRAQSIYSKMTGQHFEIILVDDPQDDENTKTKTTIERVKTKIKNARSVLEPEGWFVYIGTPWGRDEVTTWVSGLGFRVWKRSCVVDAKTGENARVPDDPKYDHTVKVVFPAKFTIEGLRKKKLEDGRVFFASQYEVDPLPPEAIALREEWIAYYDTLPSEIRKVYILCDPAISKSSKSDETVIVTAVQPRQGPTHVVKSKGFRAPVQKVVDSIMAEYKYWKDRHAPDIGVYVETGAFQHALKQWIEAEQRRVHLYFGVEELKSGKRPKSVRIGKLQPMFENGGIVFSRNGCQDLISQALRYDGSARAHDDHVDCLAYLAEVVEDSVDVNFYETLKIKDIYTPGTEEALIMENEWGKYAVAGWRDG